MSTRSGSIYVGDVQNGQVDTAGVRPEDRSQYIKEHHPEIALEELAEASDHVLYEIKNVFPLDLWPDKLRIALNQLEIIYKHDFFSRYIYPIPINKILTVRVHKGLFFAEMEIEVEGHEQNPSHIKYLSKHEADEASQLILGLKIAHSEKINLQQIPKKELIEKVKQVASTQKTP